MRFQLVPSTITVTINFPALDRLITYLQSADGTAAKLAELTTQLAQSSTAEKAAVDAAQPPTP